MFWRSGPVTRRPITPRWSNDQADSPTLVVSSLFLYCFAGPTYAASPDIVLEMRLKRFTRLALSLPALPLERKSFA